MPITRRTFLGSVGAGAVMTAIPTGAMPVSGGVLASSAGGGSELFAVVSEHATWAVFDNPQHAFHEAELIRQSGSIVANPVRCTPQLAQQFQAGNLSGFVELDGWALTSREAEKRGLDLLRHARDKQAVRRQLLDHHFKQAKRWLEDHDDARADVRYYAVRRTDPDLIRCLEDLENVPDDCQVSRCSRRLFDALAAYLENDQPRPQISKLTSFHMLVEEHGERLNDDLLYRIVVTGPDARREVVRLKDTLLDSVVAIGKSCRWVFGAGNTAEDALEMASVVEPYIMDELVVARASQTLAHAVLENGFEVPGFWKNVRGVLRHEVELASPRSVLGK